MRNNRGSAIVEFAIIFPIVLSIMLGAIYFSLAMYSRTVCGGAVRDAARTIAITPDLYEKIDTNNNYVVKEANTIATNYVKKYGGLKLGKESFEISKISKDKNRVTVKGKLSVLAVVPNAYIPTYKKEDYHILTAEYLIETGDSDCQSH